MAGSGDRIAQSEQEMRAGQVMALWPGERVAIDIGENVSAVAFEIGLQLGGSRACSVYAKPRFACDGDQLPPAVRVNADQ